MKTKQQVYKILHDQAGQFVSGQHLAQQVGVSRNAIWKAVTALKKEGVEISTSLCGYCLVDSGPELFEEGIRQGLDDKQIKIVVKQTATSTNDEAKKLLGTHDTAVVLASAQTQGRGRGGKDFFSPEGSGLYMSILVKKQFDLHCANLLTAMTAVAVSDAMEKISDKKTQIKWVNDIFIDGKKACGILTEGAISLESNCLEHIVVGIGINVFPPKNGFGELKNIATAMFEGENDCKRQLASTVINNFFKNLKTFEEKTFLQKYRQKCLTIGKQVEFFQNGEKVTGRAMDVDGNCHLVVDVGGKTTKVSSGKVNVNSHI